MKRQPNIHAQIHTFWKKCSKPIALVEKDVTSRWQQRNRDDGGLKAFDNRRFSSVKECIMKL